MSARVRPFDRSLRPRVGIALFVGLAIMLAACGSSEPEPLGEESARALGDLVADGMRFESGGLIQPGEAECISDGLVSTGLVDDLFQDSRLRVRDFFFSFDDINNLSTERRATVFLVMLRCLPTETLIQLGDLSS